LQDYQGGRDYSSLETFAKENLKPLCSPANIDLCDADKKKDIEKYMAMTPAELEAAIKEQEDKQTKVEDDFKTLVDGLQKTYQEANEAKDKALADIKDSGLGLMKAVKATAGKKAKNDEL
jgi:hypothetical protein